ncbi:MAG: D-alanyl-D-alanine carboxypeptidase/D-alanyl-D-alanine-endopeptidase [Bacteroidota bacterium]
MRHLLILLSLLSAVSCATDPPLAAQRLEEALLELENNPSLFHAQLGLSVVDLDNGSIIASIEPERALIPASTQKLITTAAALDMLGSSARFRTRLFVDGEIDQGTLKGHIYIVGGGDPTLGSPSMDEAKDLSEVVDAWATAVRATGIRRIEGYVIGDGSYYGTAGLDMNWPWSDLGNYYGAGAYGLNLHENLYYLDFRRTNQIGSTPEVARIRPQIPELFIQNEVRIAEAGTGDNAYIYGAPFNYQHFLRGTIPAGSSRFTIKGSLPDPPLFAAQQLQSRLEEMGIETVRPATSARLLELPYTGNGQEIHRIESPGMLDICKRTNLRSVNLYAEALLREINKSRATEVFSLGSPERVLDWLGEKGISTAGVRLDDGSGLSPRNYFPPRLLTDLLYLLREDEEFRGTIPLAGRSGSLRNRFRNTAAEGRLYAKSGSLSGVRAYAGYVFRTDGRKLAFCIMVNNYSGSSGDISRQLQQFMISLCTAELEEG